MKCIKIRKCHLKLLPEMNGLMNGIHYPTWRQAIKFLSQGKYSFNQSHKTTFPVYLVIKSFINVMDGKSTVCVTLQNIGKLLGAICDLDLFSYRFPVEMEMFMLNFQMPKILLSLKREFQDVIDAISHGIVS